MPNVVQGPWSVPPVRKPWRRLTKAEKSAFKVWEAWFVGLLVKLNRTGRESLSAGQPVSASDCITTAPYYGGRGLSIAQAKQINLLSDMPPIPLVWPDDYALDVAKGVIENLSGRSNSQ